MRITNNMLVKDMLWNANKNLVSMSKQQTNLSSGVKIHRPSDDPVGVTQVLKYKTDIREAEQYKENVRDAQGWLEVSESSIIDIKDVLQRVRELTVQAANGTYNSDDTSKIKTEIEQLTNEVVTLGNSSIAGRYIFSGLETNQKLFNEDGTYNIELTAGRIAAKKTMTYEVSVGEGINVGTYPTDIFGVISGNSFFEGLVSPQTTSSVKAESSAFKADVDLTHDYSSDTLDLKLGASTFDVDESGLTGTSFIPLSRDAILDAYRSASDGSQTLGDVANVYFDQNNQLVISAKTPGTSANITDLTASAGLSNKTVTAGVNGASGVISTSLPINDSDVSAYTGKSSVVLKINGEKQTIELDFSTLNSVADLQSAIQTEADAKFGAGTVTVSGASGSPMSFTINGTNDGKTSELSVDYVYSNESELITDLKNLQLALDTKDDTTIQSILGKLDVHLDRVLTAAGEIGGKSNRVDFISARIEENILTYTGLLSKVQDVDMAEAIMNFQNTQNIYRASLSVGSKVIQPSLVDFIS